MTGYQYNGKLKGEADPWQQRLKPGPQPGYQVTATAACLPNDPRLKRDTPPVRKPYGNALRRKGCGTAAGVSWHKRRGEPPCDPCREARAKEYRERAKLECGTLRGYRWHLRKGDTPCAPCQAAGDEDKRQACGSYRGVTKHKRAKEPLCDPCRQAKTEYRRQARLRKQAEI